MDSGAEAGLGAVYMMGLLGFKGEGDEGRGRIGFAVDCLSLLS